ncbi:MAG TPA: MBL fold metallo-hydrolase [Candidatus Acidoferrales bacterium]|nr:MBL fold metallo-hydrolase [Candidatus Acidoferrales bacterium]
MSSGNPKPVANSGRLLVTVLGSGTSMGVPTLACQCDVCHSSDLHDKRTRPSVLLSYNGRNVVIDTTPDFREQALRARITHLDAILYTHAHADHILGLDDIRPFNAKQKSPIPVYASQETLSILRRTFAYVFEPQSVESSIPQVKLHTLTGEFELFGARVIPVPAQHGPLTVHGFRIGSVAYLTDFSSIPDSSKVLLCNLDHLILDALRYTPHPMHSTVDQSLALVRELAPRRAWFTHICHDLGHEGTNAKLPANVRLAFDGLEFGVSL